TDTGQLGQRTRRRPPGDLLGVDRIQRRRGGAKRPYPVGGLVCALEQERDAAQIGDRIAGWHVPDGSRLPPPIRAEPAEWAVMSTTLRASVAVALLVGFYVVVVALVGGLATAAVWMWRTHPGAAAGKLSIIVLALAIGVVVALWKVLRARP